MVQDQLTDYISSQMKLGVSRDAIKSALVSAGWVAGDVEDTLKKAEGGGSAVAGAASSLGAKPAQSVSTGAGGAGAGASSPFFSSTSAGSSNAGVTKSGDPQMIRVSDLVSSSPSKTTAAAATTSTKFDGKITGNTFEASPSSMKSGSGGSSKGSGALIMEIVGGIVILALVGVAWYLYSQNGSLSDKVTALTAQSAQVSAQLTTLQTQMDASSTGLEAQLASLTAANTDLALNLSFFAVPLDSTNATSSLPITISGSLGGGGKAPYSIITPRGSKIYIANSTNAQIAAQLKPLLTQTIELTGSYIQGSDEITVSSVSSISGPATPPTVATTTATSTMPAATASTTATSTQ